MRKYVEVGTWTLTRDRAIEVFNRHSWPWKGRDEITALYGIDPSHVTEALAFVMQGYGLARLAGWPTGSRGWPSPAPEPPDELSRYAASGPRSLSLDRLVGFEDYLAGYSSSDQMIVIEEELGVDASDYQEIHEWLNRGYAVLPLPWLLAD